MQPETKKYLLSAVFVACLVFVAFYGSYAGMRSEQPKNPSIREVQSDPPQEPAQSVERPATANHGNTDPVPLSVNMGRNGEPEIHVKLMNTGQSESEAAKSENKDEYNASTNRWLLYVTIVLAFIAIVQSVLYFWQAGITQRAVDLARREFIYTHRPIIVCRGFLSIKPFGSERNYRVLFGLYNRGDADANIIEIRGLADFRTNGCVYTPIATISTPEMPTVLPPGMEIRVDLQYVMDEEMAYAELTGGSFSARVIYADAIGRKRTAARFFDVDWQSGSFTRRDASEYDD